MLVPTKNFINIPIEMLKSFKQHLVTKKLNEELNWCRE